MTDRLFRSMTPDRDSRKSKLVIKTPTYNYDTGLWDGKMRLEIERPTEDSVACPRCGTSYFAGDWPFCNGKPEDHKR